MGRNASGTIRTDLVIRNQANGDRYVYERKSQYNKEKGYYVQVGASILLGKMKPGSNDRTDLLPTRPKARPESSKSVNKITTSVSHTGMIEIIRHIEAVSGIKNEIETTFVDYAGLSLKVRTLAWYDFATDGDTWPGIRNWSLRYAGKLPYNSGIFSEDMYHDVFVILGNNADLQQRLFAQRANGILADGLLALDSTTVETFSEKGGVNRKSVHKDKLIKKVYKIVYLYSIDQRKPIAFAIIPGNIPDSMTVANSIEQIRALSLTSAELVHDNGYCTDGTICTMLCENQHFITRIEAGIKWVGDLIDANRDELEHGGEIIEIDPKFTGKKFRVERTFKTRKKKGLPDSGQSVTSCVNLFVYYSSVNKAKDDVYFRQKFNSYADDLRYEKALCDDRKVIEKFAAKYMNIESPGGSPL